MTVDEWMMMIMIRRLVSALLAWGTLRPTDSDGGRETSHIRRMGHCETRPHTSIIIVSCQTRRQRLRSLDSEVTRE